MRFTSRTSVDKELPRVLYEYADGYGLILTSPRDLTVLSLENAWRKNAEKVARSLITHLRKRFFDKRYVPPNIAHVTTSLVDDGIANSLIT
jgi:hypothetical protein